MIVLALAQQKGGVGKSTLAINLATAAMEYRRRPAIIDMDHGQGTVTKWFTRRQAQGMTEPNVVKADSATIDAVIDSLKSAGYNFILIDLPGKSSPAIGAGLKPADLVLIPSRPHDVDIEASLDTVKACLRMGKPYAYIMNITTPHPTRAAQVAAVLRKAKHPVATPHIVQRIAVADAVTAGLGINEAARGSVAAREFDSMLLWILTHLKGLGHEQALATQH